MSSFITSAPQRRGNKAARIGNSYSSASSSNAGFPKNKRTHAELSKNLRSKQRTTIIGDSNSNGLVIQGSHEKDGHDPNSDAHDRENEFPVIYSGRGVLSFKSPVKISSIDSSTNVNGTLSVKDNLFVGQAFTVTDFNATDVVATGTVSSTDVTATGTVSSTDVTATGTVKSVDFEFPDGDTANRDLFSNKASGNVSILKNSAADITIGPTTVLQTGAGTRITSYNRPMTVGCLGGAGSIRFLTSYGNHLTMTSLGDVTSNMRNVTLDSSVTGGHLNLRATGAGNTIISHEEHNFLNGIDVTGTVASTDVTATGTVSGATVTATGTVSSTDVTATGTVSGTSVTATGEVSGSIVTATGIITGGNISSSGTVFGKTFAAATDTGDVDLFKNSPNATGGFNVFRTTTGNNLIGPSSGPGQMFLRTFDGRLFLTSDGPSGYIDMHSTHGKIEIDAKGAGDLSLDASGTGDISLDASGTGDILLNTSGSGTGRIRSLVRHIFSNGIDLSGTMYGDSIELTGTAIVGSLATSGSIGGLSVTALDNVTAPNFNASNGITFDNGLNTLGAYSSGTWTPVLVNASLTFTYGAQSGTYTRIGNRMIVDGYLTWSNKTGSSGAIVHLQLPFPSASSPVHVYPGSIGRFSGISQDNSRIVAGIYSSSGTSLAGISRINTGASPGTVAAIGTDFATSGSIYFNITYTV